LKSLPPGMSRCIAQYDSRPRPFCCANVVSWVASAWRNTSLRVSLTPIIGVTPIIAHSCASVLPVKMGLIWLNVALAAWMARLPIAVDALP
jgi:hypothetical protein